MPEVRSDESQKEFIQRCMSDEQMSKEFPERDQRYAVCQAKFKEGSK